MLRKFLFLLASGLLACQAALAQQVLFLSTNETADGGLTNNAYNAFAANTVVTSLGGVVDGPGSATPRRSTPPYSTARKWSC